MCKVSTLRPVQPTSLKCLQGSKLLPKIDETQLEIVPVEYAGLLELHRITNVSLPSLPSLTDKKPVSFRRREVKNVQAVVEENSQVQPIRKVPSPPTGPRPSSRRSGKENVEDGAEPKELGNETKLLQRRKLTKSLTVPLMKKDEERFAEEINQSVSTLAGTSKRRPGTPFVLSRTQSGGHRMMQTWLIGEEEEVVEFPTMISSGCRKIQRDKVSEGSFPTLAGGAKKISDKIDMTPCKIRMDPQAFQQWITEQRAF